MESTKDSIEAKEENVVKDDIEEEQKEESSEEDLASDDDNAIDVDPKSVGAGGKEKMKKGSEAAASKPVLHKINMETKDTQTKPTSSSDDAIGVGAGTRDKKKCSAPSKKSVAAASASKSTKPLKKIDEKWPADIPDSYKKCIKDCHHILREAMHQGKFNFCWAVALTRYLEALIALERKEVVHLSAQHLINNIRNKQKKSGKITTYEEVKHFLKYEGLVLESVCPYTGGLNETCSKTCQNCDQPRYKIEDLICIEENDVNEEELIEIVHKTPVAAVIEVYDSFQAYKDGVYEGPTNYEVRKKVAEQHVVLLTGYGSTPDGIHYWTIQNSWGTSWGQHGFGKIMRKSSRGGNKPSLLIKVVRLLI